MLSLVLLRKDQKQKLARERIFLPNSPNSGILPVIDQSMRTSTGKKCQPQMRIERFDSFCFDSKPQLFGKFEKLAARIFLRFWCSLFSFWPREIIIGLKRNSRSPGKHGYKLLRLQRNKGQRLFGGEHILLIISPANT